MTFYDVLDVEPAAPHEEIKRAYRRLCKQWHPDRHPGSLEAEERQRAINEAYETLSDSEKRTRYDALLAGATPGRDKHDLITIRWATACCGGSVPYRGRKVVIPCGLEETDRIRLRGAGEPGDPPGDLWLRPRILPDPVYRRTRDLVEREYHVTLRQAYCGSPLKIHSPWRVAEIQLPRLMPSGHTHLLRGLGWPSQKGDPSKRGDLRLYFRVSLGDYDSRIAAVLAEVEDAAG